MSLNPTHAATLAIRARDVDALGEAFTDLESAAAYRTNTLPLLSAEECRWFWQQIMTPEQINSLLNSVRTVCLRAAQNADLVPGVHYSLSVLDELPTLICSHQVSQVFYAQIPPERHSVLRFYLQITT